MSRQQRAGAEDVRTRPESDPPQKACHAVLLCRIVRPALRRNGLRSSGAEVALLATLGGDVTGSGGQSTRGAHDSDAKHGSVPGLRKGGGRLVGRLVCR